MKEDCDTPEPAQPPETSKDQPYSAEEPAPTMRLQDGSQLLFSPPNIVSSRRPVASLGHFKNGEPALHFRAYRRKAPGVYCISSDGVSFSLPEFGKIVRRVRELCREVPEMQIAMGGGLDE